MAAKIIIMRMPITQNFNNIIPFEAFGNIQDQTLAGGLHHIYSRVCHPNFSNSGKDSDYLTILRFSDSLSK